MASIPAGTFNNFTFDQFEFLYERQIHFEYGVHRPHSYFVPSLEKDYIFWWLKWIGVGGTCTRACPTPMLLEDANFPGRRSTTHQALLQRKFTRQHRDSCRNIFFIFFLFKKKDSFRGHCRPRWTAPVILKKILDRVLLVCGKVHLVNTYDTCTRTCMSV